MVTDDDGRRPIAMGHLNDSGDFKIWFIVVSLIGIYHLEDSYIIFRNDKARGSHTYVNLPEYVSFAAATFYDIIKVLKYWKPGFC